MQWEECTTEQAVMSLVLPVVQDGAVRAKSYGGGGVG